MEFRLDGARLSQGWHEGDAGAYWRKQSRPPCRACPSFLFSSKFGIHFFVSLAADLTHKTHCHTFQIHFNTLKVANEATTPTAINTEYAKKTPDTVSFLMGMVEARGFEPLSEDNATQASTGVVTVLLSPERPPRNRLSQGSA